MHTGVSTCDWLDLCCFTWCHQSADKDDKCSCDILRIFGNYLQDEGIGLYLGYCFFGGGFHLLFAFSLNLMYWLCILFIDVIFFSGPKMMQIVGNRGSDDQYLEPMYICSENLEIASDEMWFTEEFWGVCTVPGCFHFHSFSAALCLHFTVFWRLVLCFLPHCIYSVTLLALQFLINYTKYRFIIMNNPF